MNFISPVISLISILLRQPFNPLPVPKLNSEAISLQLTINCREIGIDENSITDTSLITLWVN